VTKSTTSSVCVRCDVPIGRADGFCPACARVIRESFQEAFRGGGKEASMPRGNPIDQLPELYFRGGGADV